jgi:hypothetical protein
MKLEFAFLADAATILENGLFDVIGGGFDVFKARTFPATKYGLVLIGRILFDPEECGKKYTVVGEIIDSNGKRIFPPMEAFPEPNRHPRPPNTQPTWVTVCFNCLGVVVDAPGDYFFRLTVDNRVLGQVMIQVIQEEGQS